MKLTGGNSDTIFRFIQIKIKIKIEIKIKQNCLSSMPPARRSNYPRDPLQ